MKEVQKEKGGKKGGKRTSHGNVFYEQILKINVTCKYTFFNIGRYDISYLIK